MDLDRKKLLEAAQLCATVCAAKSANVSDTLVQLDCDLTKLVLGAYANMRGARATVQGESDTGWSCNVSASALLVFAKSAPLDACTLKLVGSGRAGVLVCTSGPCCHRLPIVLESMDVEPPQTNGAIEVSEADLHRAYAGIGWVFGVGKGGTMPIHDAVSLCAGDGQLEVGAIGPSGATRAIVTIPCDGALDMTGSPITSGLMQLWASQCTGGPEDRVTISRTNTTAVLEFGDGMCIWGQALECDMSQVLAVQFKPGNVVVNTTADVLAKSIHRVAAATPKDSPEISLTFTEDRAQVRNRPNGLPGYTEASDGCIVAAQVPGPSLVFCSYSLVGAALKAAKESPIELSFHATQQGDGFVSELKPIVIRHNGIEAVVQVINPSGRV